MAKKKKFDWEKILRVFFALLAIVCVVFAALQTDVRLTVVFSMCAIINYLTAIHIGD